MNNELIELPYSYCGLLDDVVAKYYVDFNTEDLFNKILAKSMFFGGGLYINDGYLLMNAVAREQMRDPASLLSSMLEFGFVKIFTRCESVEKLIDLPEPDPDLKKPESHIEFSKTEEWEFFKPKFWAPIVSEAWQSDYVVPWGKPKNHKIQTYLLNRVLRYPPKDIGLSCDQQVSEKILQEFMLADPYGGAARTKFENACISVLNRMIPVELRPQLLKQLMSIANEAYHYAFGASLTHQRGSSVAADTTMSAAFNEFIERPDIEFRNFVDIPLFGIPADADLARGERYEELLRFDGEGYQAKAQFVSQLQKVFVEGNWGDRIDGLVDNYISQLSKLLGLSKDLFRRDDRSKSIALVKDAPGAKYLAAATSIAGLSTQITSRSVESLRSQFARYTVIDPGRSQEIEFSAQDVFPQTTALALSVDFVDSILSNPFFSDNTTYDEYKLKFPGSDFI